MRLLFLGDVMGRSGRAIVSALLPGLIARHAFDFVIVNGENAAGGFGITEEIFLGLIEAGADCVTTGNHVWDQREALVFAERQERFLRPVNYPPGTPGRGANVYTAKNGGRVLVVNVMGAIFMPALVTDMVDGVVWIPTNSPGSTLRRTLGVTEGAVVEISTAGGSK